MFVFDGFRGCIYLKYYGPGQLASFFHFYELYQYQYLRPSFFFPVSPPGFLRIFWQPKKKTELNRGGQAKQTNVVAWDSGSKRSQ